MVADPATLRGVPTSAIATAISFSIAGFRLLDHPYYQAWQDGELRMADLKGYAEQYRHFERSLPAVLSEAAAAMGPGRPRQLIEANLADELANPRPHLEMFDGFGHAVGAVTEVGASEATAELVGVYRDAARTGPVPLLAVVAAYETQGAEIATTKAAALSARYGLNGAGTEFWTVHAAVEQEHSAWTVQALEDLNSSSDEVEHWASRSAQAWWHFLDERQAARAA